MRKNKKLLLAALLLLGVGFAAVSTTLYINGNVGIATNEADFDVRFTSATLDQTDISSTAISEDGKTITYGTNELSMVGDKSTLDFEITNNSELYDAEVSIECTASGEKSDYYTITKDVASTIVAKTTEAGKVEVELTTATTEDITESFTCTLTAQATERTTKGEAVSVTPVSFADDTWETIGAAVKAGNISAYNVGDTKTVDLGDLRTHTVRVANTSACTNGETSQTACGFVVEFADIITSQAMNSSNTNVGGWPASKMRTYVNETIYNALPSNLQGVIADTTVVSGHGSTSGEANFTSTDKLYLLSTKEVWGKEGTSNTISNDTAESETRQLDYYANLGVTTSNYSGAIKQYNSKDSAWWLRSAFSNNSYYFFRVMSSGDWSSGIAYYTDGVSPAFRIA